MAIRDEVLEEILKEFTDQPKAHPKPGNRIKAFVCQIPVRNPLINRRRTKALKISLHIVHCSFIVHFSLFTVHLITNLHSLFFHTSPA